MKGIIFFLLISVTFLLAGGIPIPKAEAPVKDNEIIVDPKLKFDQWWEG